MAAALSCPVCYYDYLDDPKILTCGHTICKKCLEVIYLQSEFGHQLRCPICRHVNPVPGGNISKLTTNLAVKSLVEDQSSTQSNLEKLAEIKIKRLIEHAYYVNQQKQQVKLAISVCRCEVQKIHDEAVTKLAEKKGVLLRKCDNHESALLEKLDKLVQKDNELVSRISNARELMGNNIRDLGTQYPDTLKNLLKTTDPNLSEATAITRRGEMLHFNKKQVYLDFGEVKEGEIKWIEKICVKPSEEIYCTAPSPDGRMAVAFGSGGIQIYSADGELQQTVLQNVQIGKVAFLSDGRCVVRDTNYDISLYTPEWNKLDVRFDSLKECSSVDVDCENLIYVGYWTSKKIRVFRPSGGKAIREIRCGGYEPLQVSVMEPSKMLLVSTYAYDTRVLDQQGKEVHSVVIEENDTCLCFATVCKDSAILIAAINNEQDRVSIKQYTSELIYVKTLIADHVIEKTESIGYYIREFSSGELALCTSDRLYIFHNMVSLPEE